MKCFIITRHFVTERFITTKHLITKRFIITKHPITKRFIVRKRSIVTKHLITKHFIIYKKTTDQDIASQETSLLVTFTTKTAGFYTWTLQAAAGRGRILTLQYPPHIISQYTELLLQANQFPTFCTVLRQQQQHMGAFTGYFSGITFCCRAKSVLWRRQSHR